MESVTLALVFGDLETATGNGKCMYGTTSLTVAYFLLVQCILNIEQHTTYSYSNRRRNSQYQETCYRVRVFFHL